VGRYNESLFKLRQAIRPYLSNTSGVVLIGVSGGADSMALAAATLAESSGRRVIPVVVDHGLQENSAEVASLVINRLKKMGFDEIFSVRASVELKDGLEASARRARYKVFEQATETYGAEIFLLGHNKNDQAESVLLGLVRGSGTRSLSGMREQNGIYVRPFLDISRETIEEACSESGLEIWSDPHNENLEFKRVMIRRESIPKLENDLGPGVIDALARSARIMSEDADALDEWASRAVDEIGSNNLDISKLVALPKAVRARVLRNAIYASGAPSGSISAEHLKPVESLVTAWEGQGECSLPGGVKVSRISGRITLSNR
jgi:tRNA(Ile)-lysidine synthase